MATLSDRGVVIALCSLERRPELGRVLDQLRPEDTLVVWMLGALAAPWARHDRRLGGPPVGFSLVAAERRTTASDDRLMFHVCAALAEFERDLILERIEAGLQAARA